MQDIHGARHRSGATGEPPTGLRALALAIGCLVAGLSSAAAETLSVSPIPDDAEGRFCYYAGLAYSEAASITLDVPNRRDSTTATQKREFTCSRDEGKDNLIWVEIDIERRGLSGN
jgi:hypothetical protein